MTSIRHSVSINHLNDPWFDEPCDIFPRREFSILRSDPFDDFDRVVARQRKMMDEMMERHRRWTDEAFSRRNDFLDLEMPRLEAPRVFQSQTSFPRVDSANQNVSIRLNLPRDLDPSKINVQLNNNELIVRGEDKVDKPGHKSSTSFYQRTTLPSNTNFDAMKAVYDNVTLNITAPLNQSIQHSGRALPIQYNRNWACFENHDRSRW